MKKQFWFEATTISTILHWIKEQLETIEIKNASKIEIAVDEVISNVMSYSKSPFVDIDCYEGQDKRVCIEVRDRGVPFNPILFSKMEDEEKKSKGYGIFLILQLASHVSYRYEENHNILTLNFDVSKTRE